MPHITLPEPPLSTPLFRDLSVRALLRGQGSLFRFLVDHVWADWFGMVAEKARPLTVKATLDFPNTLAQTSSDLTVSVLGAETDHFAEVVPPTALWVANCAFVAFVSAVNVVTVRF